METAALRLLKINVIKNKMDILYTSAIGILRTIIGLPIEHPFDYVKTQLQANPYTNPFRFVLNDIKTNGFMKLYTGIIPNAIRNSIKESYRYPMMIHFPRLYRRFVTKEI